MRQIRKQTQFVSVATVLLIVLVAVVIGRQSLRSALTLVLLPQPVPLASNNAPTPTSTNEFDLATTKAGDTVAGLTVAEVRPYYEGLPLDLDNAIVRFSGTLTLQGYAYDLSGTPCFEVADEQSRSHVPRMRGDGRVVNFCFSNGEFARSSLQPLDIGNRVTVVIDHYTTRSYPNGDSANLADLVSVISKEKI